MNIRILKNNILILLIITLCSININAKEIRTLGNTSRDSSAIYKGVYLTGLDFPIGSLGGGVIRMNGKAERVWWQIFNNFEERSGSGIVPNSFFAIRASTKNNSVVKALQTSSVGPFAAMDSLIFQGEYPFGRYTFFDKKLPVKVTLEAYNPLIPMDLKNSAIPCAIFNVKVKNTSSNEVKINLLAAQENAVGFSGYDTIAGPNLRYCKGFGENKNEIVIKPGITSLNMIGPNGSMQLSAYSKNVSYTASWDNLEFLYNDFSNDGRITGVKTAVSPKPEMTIAGALSAGFLLRPNEEKVITFVLTWYFPNGTFGKEGSKWYFKNAGSQYENWWKDASDVGNYVAKNISYLDSTTRLYDETIYSSNIPRYVLDRITSNICVLKSPTTFWTKDGYFGIWESTSNDEVWGGNCKHVIHYAQGIARLYPGLARRLRMQDLNTITDNGMLPARDGGTTMALDGQLGTILEVYRENLLSDNSGFLTAAWPRTRLAMNYVINTFDKNHDGLLYGSYHNTLDCNVSGTSPWIGSLYLAALKACEKMAIIMGDTKSAGIYHKIWEAGIRNQNKQLWNDSLGYYISKPDNLPNTLIMGKAVSIDMFLGQWWANQLNLGQIYPLKRTKEGLSKIFTTNKYTDTGKGYFPSFRNFLGSGKTGWEMFVFPGKLPKDHINYYNEVMSGFEYAAAATMLQYGMIHDGLSIVKAISERYNGRLRAKGEVTLGSNACVFGTGSPFGEDECGDFYVRPLSSWSLLLALQGFIFNGPEQTIGFKPVWQPENHVSFFSGSDGWGLYQQKRSRSVLRSSINVKYGEVKIKNIILELPKSKSEKKLFVTLDGVKQRVKNTEQKNGTFVIHLVSSCTVQSGSSLKIQVDMNK